MNISQTLQVNNLRNLMVKNAKFSGYYYYMNTKKFSNLQECTFKLKRNKKISVYIFTLHVPNTVKINNKKIKMKEPYSVHSALGIHVWPNKYNRRNQFDQHQHYI